jgi:hypothetical protein
MTTIWVVNPVLRHVYGHRGDGSLAKFRPNDTIKDEPLLSGLVAKVSDFFPNAPLVSN